MEEIRYLISVNGFKNRTQEEKAEKNIKLHDVTFHVCDSFEITMILYDYGHIIQPYQTVIILKCNMHTSIL